MTSAWGVRILGTVVIATVIAAVVAAIVILGARQGRPRQRGAVARPAELRR